MGSSPVVGVVTAVASASSAATPPSPGNTCLSARTNSQILGFRFWQRQRRTSIYDGCRYAGALEHTWAYATFIT